MRLLLFAQQFKDTWSGPGTYARGLAEGLARRGHQVTLALPRGQCRATRGVRLIPMAFAPGNLTPGAFLRMTRAYRRVLGAEALRHDLVHFLDARERALGGAAGTAPVFGTIHDAYALEWRYPSYPRHLYHDRFLRGLYYAWLRRVERAAYRRTWRFAANSRHVAEAVANGHGVSRDRIVVVPYGLPDLPPVAPERLAGDPSLLFVGGNFQRKGLRTLIEALAELRRARPRARLHVVGRDPRQAAFAAAARGLGVGESVEFHGWQPNHRVRALMAGATVLVMPSLVEGFGLVYLEAMRAGTPVLATASGGAREFFRDGEEVLLLRPGSAPALALALERVVADTALRERLIAGGRSAASRFTVEEMVRRTEEIYQGVG